MRVARLLITVFIIFFSQAGIQAQAISLPYSTDFENGTNGWIATSVPGSDWQLGYPNYGSTSGVHSGINAWDINLNSPYSNSANAELISPNLDLTGISSAYITFWVNYNCETNFDGTHIEYSLDGGFSWNYLGGVADPAGINWYNSLINANGLPAWNGNSGGWQYCSYKFLNSSGASSLKLKYVFVSDPSVTLDGFSIDDFNVTPAPPVDAAICAIITPGNAPVNSTVLPEICISNNGTQSFTVNAVSYQVDNSSPVTEFPSITLLTSQSTNYLFNSAFTTGPGQHQLKVWVTQPGDTLNYNDTMLTAFQVFAVFPVPVFDDFENGSVGWYDQSSGPGTNWEPGTPNFGQTTGAFSGINAWDINLNTAYGPSAVSNLISPGYDFSIPGLYTLSFMQNRNSELNWDGMRLEYQDSLSAPWQLLGSFGDINGINWYSNSLINSSSLPAWDGSSNGWQKSSYTFNVATPTIMYFRFVFTSDASISTDGISIDDFSIIKTSDYDVSIDSVFAPTGIFYQGNPFYASVKLTNHGSLPVTSATIYASLNNGPASPVTYTGSLPFSNSVIVSLPSLITGAGLNNLLVYISYPNDSNQLNDTLRYQFQAISAYDAALTNLQVPNGVLLQGNPVTPTVTLNNFGGNVLTSATIYTSFNNSSFTSTNYLGNIPNNASANVSLPTFIMNGGLNTIFAYVVYSGDSNPSNDTIQYSFVTASRFNIPYSENFDSNNTSWLTTSTGLGGTNWEHGMPAYGSTNSVHSGTACWDINLTTPYGNVARAALYTPAFDINFNTSLQLSCWINYATEAGHDGLQVEYNTGNAWNLLGTANDPNGVNWYDGNLNSVGTDGWSGLSNGWKQVSYNTTQFAGFSGVQFRFLFSSDLILSGTGASMDDFSISMITGLHDLTVVPSAITLYPDPADAYINLQQNEFTDRYTVSLFDEAGRKVFEQEEKGGLITLYLVDISRGFYIVEITDQHKVARKKFTKQ